LKDKLLALFPSVVFTYEEKDTLWCEVDGIKLSFISRRAPCIDSFIEEDCFRIASLRDLLAMKLNAVCGREEYKDYYDLALLLDHVPGSEWLDVWKKVYPQSDPVSWLVALAYVPQVVEISLRGTNIQSKKVIEDKLLQFVKGL
jgi:predicted nucleotidyltransferase component of viral defense system